MAYSVANPPFLIVPAMGGGFAASVQGAGGAGSSDCGGNLWGYRSTEAAGAMMSTAGGGYFTNGHKLGMRKGDIVLYTQLSTAFSISNIGMGAITGVTASSAAMMTVLGTSSTA